MDQALTCQRRIEKQQQNNMLFCGRYLFFGENLMYVRDILLKKQFEVKTDDKSARLSVKLVQNFVETSRPFTVSIHFKYVILAGKFVFFFFRLGNFLKNRHFQLLVKPKIVFSERTSLQSMASARASFFLHVDCARQNRDFARQMKIPTLDILRKQR